MERPRYLKHILALFSIGGTLLLPRCAQSAQPPREVNTGITAQSVEEFYSQSRILMESWLNEQGFVRQPIEMPEIAGGTIEFWKKGDSPAPESAMIASDLAWMYDKILATFPNEIGTIPQVDTRPFAGHTFFCSTFYHSIILYRQR